ncbi:hypothetical protein L1049_009514 [Liquidambar formosana]|uniref:Uncharacterized protein n=1 Tax=Liquidambar formosana TaxID=63359 RepID=A0AAP0N854_LIQFO
MELPASAVVPPTSNDTAQKADGIYKEVVDVYMSNENVQESEFMAIQEPYTLVGNESLQKEKQISVDPISLKESSTRDASSLSRLVLPPINTGPKVTGMYPPLPLAKPKFLSSSLPNSATSSPRFGSILLKKKGRHQSPASPLQVNNVVRQHSAVHSLLTLRQESCLRRSKSCGEGRACAPSNEFDLRLNKVVNGTEHEHEIRLHGSFSGTTEANKDGGGHKSVKKKNTDPYDEGFKCGALCLFLSGFGRGKPVGRARKEEARTVENVISRTVSLERFECGSWSSSAIINGNEAEEDGESVNLYFDLPMELIRTSVNDAHSPVTAAFVFDKEDRKGVLKNSSTKATRKSHESSRHVRFSTSSPTSYPASPSSCNITPRLRKAREEFNAFLEAQGSS